jgi:hypothetical protein
MNTENGDSESGVLSGCAGRISVNPGWQRRFFEANALLQLARVHCVSDVPLFFCSSVEMGDLHDQLVDVVLKILFFFFGL